MNEASREIAFIYDETVSGASVYNTFRDFSPDIGRYVESDPIGLDGGLNTYAYAYDSPLKYTDPLGQDVRVCLYPSTFGHVGIGTTSSQTSGLYPVKQALKLVFCASAPGVVQRDDPAHDWSTNANKQCLTITTSSEQDALVTEFIAQQISQQSYNLCNNQCTSFVRNALQAANIPLPANSDTTISPRTFFNILQGAYSPARTGRW